MSKNKFKNKYTEMPSAEPTVEETEVSVTEEVLEEISESSEPTPEPVEAEPIKSVFGRVNCAKLNVRENPNPSARVLCEIRLETKVEIDVRNFPVFGDIVQKRAMFSQLVANLIYIGYKVSFNGTLIIEWK